MDIWTDLPIDYVLSGFCEGFCIGFHPNCLKLKSASRNWPSSRHHVGVIVEYLTTEIHAGRVVGPLKTPPFPYLQISRFGVIPKKNKVNAWRLMLDLSFPLGHSVNDGIDKSEFPVCYAKVDDAIRLIVKLGKGALMAKVEIKKGGTYCAYSSQRLLSLGYDMAPTLLRRSSPTIWSSLCSLYL